MRKAASRTSMFAVAGAVCLVGVLTVQSVNAAAATSIEYKAQQSFTVQPGEGWLIHTQYANPQKNTTNAAMTVGPFGQDAFHCVGGECPQYLEYHFGDSLDMGTLSTGTQIRLKNSLHDNPGDGRRTRIKKDNQEVYVCAEGWVAPDCVYAVNSTGNYKVVFEDSVAVEVVKTEPVTPTATPTPTTQPTTAPTQQPTVAPTAQPAVTPSTTLPPAPGGDGKSDGRTESLGCQSASDNCSPAQGGGSVLGATTLPSTGGWSEMSILAVLLSAAAGVMGMNFLRLATIWENESN